MAAGVGQATSGRRPRWRQASSRVGVLGAGLSLVLLVSLPATSASANASGSPRSWHANGFAVGTLNGVPGNVATTGTPTVATIQQAVD